MLIKKRLVEQNENYYEYSSRYIRKYIVIFLIILLFISLVFVVTYIPYNLVPEKSLSRADIPILEDDNSIMNKRGVYYNGVFSNNTPKSIPIYNNMNENLYLYIFHDNNIVFWKIYKYKDIRYFSYNAFNIIDGDVQSFILKEENKDFLDFYDNFIRVQFKKTNAKFNLEIPNFYNSYINLETTIDNLIEAKLKFRFTNFNASMINWGRNRAYYMANYYGYPNGSLVLPGSDNNINNTSTVLAFNLVGRNPTRYIHNIIAGTIYVPYSSKAIPIFIYDTKPYSQNSKTIKIYFNNKWYEYKDFISHEYKDVIDFYSKEHGFSFVFTITSKDKILEDNFGSVRLFDNKIYFGVLSGYFTINDEQYNITGNAVLENLHKVF